MTNYESKVTVDSAVLPGVRLTIYRMSFGRRLSLMREVREIAHKLEFLESEQNAKANMEATILRAEIDRAYVRWGLDSISGLMIDGKEATPAVLADTGPEELFREALGAIRAQAGLTEEERKN
jgi:hypothetical protein